MTDSGNGTRGERFRAIREALGLTQREFAERLNAVAVLLGLPTRYEMLDISVRENERKALDVEDYAITSAIEPKRWSWHWLAFGRELTTRKAAAPTHPPTPTVRTRSEPVQEPGSGRESTRNAGPGRGRRRA